MRKLPWRQAHCHWRLLGPSRRHTTVAGGYIYKKLQSREVTTNDVLFELTEECFNEIGQETIRKLIFKVPFLLEQVLSNDGEITTG